VTNHNRHLAWTTGDILKATGGQLLTGDLSHHFAKLSIDSRTISKDEMFIAIAGERHDGHHFLKAAVQSGARGLIVNKKSCDHLKLDKLPKDDIVCVAVDDTTKALADLALFHRRRCRASIIAITGSNGKTTTRKITSAIVAQKYTLLSTKGNYNNHIGLPLTLLGLTPAHEWAVIELGMNHPGEIRQLAHICKPDLGIITNVGPAHLEGLGSLENIMQAKGELLEGLRPEGTAILNRDDPRISQLAQQTKARVLFFGLSKHAAIRARSIEEKGACISFVLSLPEKDIAINLNVPGRFMVLNALAGAAAGYLLGIPPESIKSGIETFQPAWGRMNLLKTHLGVNIIDDTYNANPGSMQAAITTLETIKGFARSALVMGDMLELGSHAESMHIKIGACAAASGISRLYVTGTWAQVVAKAAHRTGLAQDRIFTGEKAEILAHLKAWLKPGDWILIKGSRGMAMEKIVAGLQIGSRQ
jgi:UDP-N-acetylmuramoyl-tripeptide--D-alanyl-D-alanine ligase